ncbi:putative PurR-regulated permease PerM [Rhizobium sp. BK529]|uniref:AI-2E family transporter n=1 Tax=Rhizobium sp. BK529 TaxID=2586983 RepID=UPI0010433272|nr:AI-2E family transporter [Rhizobium sp. BK529]MBB3595265.1 putative PurR-regulated permease PerM [Rhizobium sp. BK529]TCS00942.1 putative PurR-regulated permease PerM [Rhizobium sp. BK418]
MVEDRTVPVTLGVIAAIAVVATLYLLAVIFAPVACALFIIAIVWPMQRLLQSHLPQMLALALVVGVIFVVFVLFASVVGWGFGRIARSLISDAPRFQMLYDQATIWLEGHGIVVAGIWGEHFNVRWAVGMLQGLTARLNTMISFWLVVLVYVLLGLLEVRPLSRKIRTVMSAETARILITGCSVTASKFRRYILIRTIMSIVTGAMVWVLALSFGLQFAAEWGVIAFTLNYIPFIGSFIATLLPTLYALAQFESVQAALIVFVCLNIIQFVIGSYIEPRVAGNALAVSSFIVLFSVFLWTFLWGLFGSFIGVPITIAILTFCEQSPATRWLADLQSAKEGAGQGP